MNAIGKTLDDVLNPGLPGLRKREVGFLLCVFEFGPAHPGQRFNYISNADALDMLATLKDITARLEGRLQPSGRA
jgi:hypothetical protein